MDPIANMFCQIHNAYGSESKTLMIPFSNLRMAILAILKKNQFITDFNEIKSDNIKKIQIELNSNRLNFRRLSRPGRRFYSTSREIPRPRGAKGLVIISTSSGMMNGEEARQKGLGGEIIAEIAKE